MHMPRTVALAGATGLVGREILRGLVADPPGIHRWPVFMCTDVGAILRDTAHLRNEIAIAVANSRMPRLVKAASLEMLFALMALALPPAAQGAPGEWQVDAAHTSADIQIYSRTNENGYPEFRGVTKIKSRLSAFVALFRDVDNMPKWAYRIKKVQQLQSISDTEVYAYTVNSLPLPLYDRDSVVRSILSQDRNTLKVTIRGSAVPDYLERDDRYVRMPVVESFWTFTPLDDGLVEVVFQGYGDPGGNLSSGLLAWFVRISLSEAPYSTLREMRKVISRSDYQSSTFSFIREPVR
jgi:hypothetical protein